MLTLLSKIGAIIASPVTLYQRGLKQLPLTPFERAILKLINGFLLAGATAGADAAFQYISTQQISEVNWSTALNVFLTMSGAGVVYAIHKWASARGDFSLAALLAKAQSGQQISAGDAVAAAGDVVHEVTVIQQQTPPAAS